ncbi:MAG: ribonuclease III [Acidimicrobiia bacterium]|jgi:ribonuclease-3|nr:ribonuclease III [Acidimicrobiia bacterium]
MGAEALACLEAALEHEFDDRDHLEHALVHRSFCAEHLETDSNERMEFLGDAVLGLSVTVHVFHAYPELPEGELAKIRASVVNAEVLADIASEIELGAALVLGKGEDASGGRSKPSILADAMEAVIAAVYLDGGWDAADALVLRLFGDRIRDGAAGPGGDDYKTRLQELAARQFDQLPRYQVRAEGPDHSKRFFATVSIAGVARGEGEGRSKKHAEQAAARAAWQRLVPDASDDEGEPARVQVGAGREDSDA